MTHNWTPSASHEICVVCPSRDHPDDLKKLVESFLETSRYANLVCWIDEDQIPMYSFLAIYPRVIRHVGSRVGPVAASNSICHHYRDPFRIYGMVPDDSRFLTPRWDEFLLSEFDRFSNRVGVIAAAHNSGPFVNFPWVTREWLNVVGYYYYPHNFHFCCDSIIELLAECAGALRYAEREEFEMLHDSDGVMNQHAFNADCLNFLTWSLGERRELVAKVRKAMT